MEKAPVSYQVQILPRAIRELDKLEKEDYLAIRGALLALSTTPRPSGCKKLAGREG